MWWSLNLRWWSWQVGLDHGKTPAQVRVFMVLHDPRSNLRVADSPGLQKGLIVVTHGFAGRTHTRRNNVIVAHELLHTVGAADEYNLATNLPIYPHGFAEPGREPLYPQLKAELMGARDQWADIPTSRAKRIPQPHYVAPRTPSR